MTSCATTTCGVGGWGGPLPGDPDNNVTLSATPAFGGIDVSWTSPTTNPQAVAYVQLYRGVSSTFANAVLLTTVGGNFFYDKSTNANLTTYYYWISIVSVNGTAGALIGPASAVAKPPIVTVIEQLTGQIDAGLLAQSLKTDIDRITLNSAEISQEIQNRISANNVFSMGLAQLQLTVEDATAYLTEEITSRQEGDSALLIQVNLIAAANAINQAAIQTEQQVRIDEDEAIALSVTQLSTQVNNETTGLPATRALLLTDYYTKATADSAISEAVTALGTTVANTLTGYTNTASLTENYYTKTDADSAISTATSTLVSTTDLDTTLDSYKTKAALEEEYYTKTSTDSAISSAVSSLVSTTALGTALGDYTTTAVLGQDFYTKTQTDNAISSATLNLVSTLGLNNALSGYTNTAALQSNYYTKNATDSAIAAATSTLVSTATLGNYSTAAAINQSFTTKVGYAVKVVQIPANVPANGIGPTLPAYEVAVTPFDGDGQTVVYPANTYPSEFFPTYAIDRTKIIDKLGVDNWNATLVSPTNPFGRNTFALRWIEGLPLATAVSNVQVTDSAGNLAGLQQAFVAQKDLNNNFKAQYTARVSVTDGTTKLIGGFGIYGDATGIEVGFDVDRFWIGRTAANKRKPFIVADGVVYIDEAAIEKLTFNKLRDQSGSFIVADGKVKADYLNVTQITGGAYTGYNWPAAGAANKGFFLGPGGLLLGNYNNGKYFQITDGGDVYAPGLSIVGGAASFSGSVSAQSFTAQSMDVALRNVIETGSLSIGQKYLAGTYADGENTWYHPANTALTVEINRLIPTSIDDDYLISTVRQQPFKSTVVATGTGTYQGGSGLFNITIDSEVVGNRRYSPGGVNASNDKKVYIYVRRFVVTCDTEFAYMLLPETINWTLSRA